MIVFGAEVDATDGPERPTNMFLEVLCWIAFSVLIFILIMTTKWK